jgi:hypothetical protein
LIDIGECIHEREDHQGYMLIQQGITSLGHDVHWCISLWKQFCFYNLRVENLQVIPLKIIVRCDEHFKQVLRWSTIRTPHNRYFESIKTIVSPKFRLSLFRVSSSPWSMLATAKFRLKVPRVTNAVETRGDLQVFGS